MLLENQYIEVKIVQSNIKHYREIGYQCNCNDKILVEAKDLYYGSSVLVNASCDYCGMVKAIPYYDYHRSIIKNGKYSCSKCKTNKRHEHTLKARQEKYYEKLINICSEEGYTLVSSQDEIKNNYSRIKYICPKHGIKEMRINNFINGKRCPDCAHDKNREKYQLDTQEIIKRFNTYGGTVLNPEEYVNQTTKNLRVICPECKKIFTTSLRNFTQHSGQVCQDCASHGESMGERRIRNFFDENNIHYLQEHWFNDCRDTNPLPFDFYLPEENTIVEFDGRQHFNSTSFFKHSQEVTPIHDKIKNKYCNDNGIKLIRIPYWDLEKVERILSKEILHKDIV